MPRAKKSHSALADALSNMPDLTLDLPDPEDEAISDFDFENSVDIAWQVCDRFDVQTDIWRGRILRAIRDREKKGGEGRGTGFLNWLKDREISKSQAYSLIELANSADTLLEGGLDEENINQFSKRAFVETAKASPEIQHLVTEAAQNGDRITRREVRQLTDEWTAMNSDLLSEEMKEKANAGTVPTKLLAPLVREMEKLPESHQVEMQREMAENPDVDTVKQLTTDARNLSKYLDAAAQVQAISDSPVDMEMALEEAIRLECVNVVADLVKQATLLEQTTVKLYKTWKRVGSLSERLFLDTGASTPHLRHLLGCLDKISGQMVEVALNEANDQTVRIQVLDDD